jgi:nucleotide-binding universal stress UspA family protein
MRAGKTEKPLICGFDDSENARRAVRVAADLARRLEAHLILLHVSEVTTPPPGPAFAYAKLQEQALATGERLLQKLCEEERLENAERQVALGTPASVLVDAAAAKGADLLVVGTRGRGALTAAVLGSVSSDVASKAPCPVVVVPSD